MLKSSGDKCDDIYALPLYPFTPMRAGVDGRLVALIVVVISELNAAV